MLPAPNVWNARARRWRGPIAPSRVIPRPRGVDRVPRDALDVLAQHRARIRRWPTPTRFRSASGCSTTSRRWATCSLKALQLGIDEVAATGRLDRDVELVERQSRGLPSGSEAEVVRAFDELDDEDVVAIVGPSISDNALIVAPLCDAARIPAINYSGGERTRSQWMFHYQVGSLEEEPPVLAAAHGRRAACAAPR